MKSDIPSDTSLLVARSVLLASKDAQLSRLLAPDEAEMLRQILAETGRAWWFEIALKNGWARQIIFWVERMMVAGVIAHYLVRKRWLEGEVREALAAGTSQVIVLGAGFDTLAARLAIEFPQILFIEIDHPATQVIKRKLPATAPNFHLIAADFTIQALVPILTSCPRFIKNQPTIILAEGLTMYLTAEKVTSLLQSAADIAGPGGRVIFTFMDQQDDGPLHFHGGNSLVTSWLQSRREPFLWGLPRALLPAWVGKIGLHCDTIVGHSELRDQFLAPQGLRHICLAQGECLCSCSPISS